MTSRKRFLPHNNKRKVRRKQPGRKEKVIRYAKDIFATIEETKGDAEVKFKRADLYIEEPLSQAFLPQ